MNAVLAAVITQFRAAQDRGVAFLEQLGVPLPASNREWVRICADFGLHSLRSVNGVGVHVHGYGVELIFADVTIDFDWGDAGEPDGFDAWRLWHFVHINLLTSFDVGRDNQGRVQSWLEEAHLRGELTRDRLLYYSPAHRAPNPSVFSL